jgi:hypothetical protein
MGIFSKALSFNPKITAARPGRLKAYKAISQPSPSIGSTKGGVYICIDRSPFGPRLGLLLRLRPEPAATDINAAGIFPSAHK